VHLAPPFSITGPERVIIAANPRAGASSPTSIVGQLADALRSRNLHVDVLTDLGQVADAANRAHAAGTLRALVAAGGDGTVAELVNRTDFGLPISVYPLGTANLLAGYLNIRPHAESFCRMICQGRTIQLDAGRAAGRIFLLMAGCGFDAEVVERLHAARQGNHINMWSYAKPILAAMRSYEYPELRIHCDNAPTGQPGEAVRTVVARWAFVVNLPRYAGQLHFAPQAVGTDGKLDVCTFERGSLWHGLKYVGSVWSGRHAALSDYSCSRARHVHIESDAPVRYQLDGDPGGMLPLDIEVLPGRLTLLAPRERAVSLGFVEHAVAGVTDRA
jgi:diacylglycerol kinase (ATP)